MLFNSLDFLLFFPAAIAGYFLTPHRWRWVVLLALSFGFYAWWRVEYVALLAGSTLIDYTAGRLMGRQATRRERLPYLATSLAVNLGLLFAFKYYGLFAQTANAVFGALEAGARIDTLDLLLPVGISFYTFQTIAYSVDVYRGSIQPERHLGYFALYVSFWPQLVAGPIERADRLLPQFRERHAFDLARLSDGLKLMTWGFFLKVVVADRIAMIVIPLVVTPGQAHGEALITSFYLGGFFLYADFQGYTLIALGAAYIMGFRLMTNFRQPYLAPSMAELWRRWHISLTQWFKDYLFVPLRHGRLRLHPAFALVLVFAITGLWHGASWRYLVWGVGMGLYLIAERLTLAPRDRLWAGARRRIRTRRSKVLAAGVTVGLDDVRKTLGIFWTYTVWVLGALAFFVQDLRHVPAILRNMLHFGNGLGEIYAILGRSSYEFRIAVAAVLLVVVLDVLERREPILERISRWPWPARSLLYATVVTTVILLGEFGQREFVYFQF